jgi:mycobactin peptide synthetase MbtE
VGSQRTTAGPPNLAPDHGLHQTVADVARRRPQAVALVAGDRSLTYEELDATADRWAAGLVAAGVRPGSLVPVLLPRGPDLVLALLAVLKAGGAYALLDPTWPQPVLAGTLADLAATVLVGNDPAVGSVPGWSPRTAPGRVPAGFRPAEVSGADPCSVFLTSGTTGRPKAVLTPHRATARLFGPGGVAPGTAMPLAAPVSWDAFSLELWSMLLTGGTSVVVPEPYLSAGSLRAAVARGADTAWLTSSLFNMVVEEDVDALGGLRRLLVGGERLSPEHVRTALRRHPALVLGNGYGPVESTVFATTHRVTEADCDRPGGIPLGRPVPGTSVSVLAGDRPCDAGEEGEICIAGDGLALGYVGDPARTADRFPLVGEDGRARRVYRTGDMGVLDADGLLHFRGRVDRQIKVGGHRIEPAEVERQIEAALPVCSCRVLSRPHPATGDPELVAFCVPARAGDRLGDASAVLRRVLLPHQRPAQVVAVGALPVTRQGKLDERALLAAVPDRSAGRPPQPGPAAWDGPVAWDGPTGLAAQDGAAAGDGVADVVAATVAAVLGRASVPADVPFAELGCSSLGAGRVAARLTARLGRPVPVSLLYRHRTVAALAAGLRDSSPPPGPPRAGGEVPLTPMQLVFLTRTLVDPADRSGHCLVTWVVDRPLDLAALESAVAAVHARHEPLRAAYGPDPRPAARGTDIGPPPVDVLPPEPTVDEALAAVRAELADDLDIGEGEVWRVAVVPAGAQWVLGVVVHHIAFDGWSEAVLADDLSLAYGGFDAGPSPPPVHPARTPPAPGEVAAVVAELADVPDLSWPAGPTGRPGPPEQVEIDLPPTVPAAADRLAARAGTSRFAVLLSRWAVALAGVTGQRDLAVGVPVAQRDDPALERAVGCHLTMLPLRLRQDVTGGDVRAAGRLVERALAAQDVPYPDVLEMLGRPRTHRPPVFQTLFALQDNRVPTLDLPGVRTALVRRPYLGLPLELHAELWPGPAGGLRLQVSWRPDAVPAGVGGRLAERYAAALRELEP